MKKGFEQNINYQEEELKDNGNDWNIVKQPVILKKKIVNPKKNDKILRDFPELKYQKKEKVALVLGGGGAKGVAHIGVIKELEKYNVDIDFISGTSMGAIVGAAYALDESLYIANKFLSYRKKDLVDFSDFSFSLKGFIKGKKAEYLLKTLYGDSKFEDARIKLLVNAVDVVTGEEVVFNSGKIVDAVRASMSLPMIFAPKKINGRYYFDGGVKNNIPYSHVPKKYKKVIVSSVTTKVQELKKINSGIHYFMHFLSVLEHNTSHIPPDKRIVVVHPNMDGINIGDFYKMKEAVQRGRDAAKKVFPKHFKKLKTYDD